MNSYFGSTNVPDAIVAIGTDNDGLGERHATHLAALIEAANLRWERAHPKRTTKPGGRPTDSFREREER